MKYLKDAREALYLYDNGYLETLNEARIQDLIGKSLSARLYKIFSRTVKEFFLLLKKDQITSLRGETVCLINSQNNLIALHPLNDVGTRFIKFTTLGKEIPSTETIYLKFKFFYSLLFIGLLPLILTSKRNRQNLILLHSAFGVQTLFQKKLCALKPSKLIFSNDHIPEMRAFLRAAKDKGIQTIYIQHAAVSPYFPPLMFDKTLLDSQYSLDVYSKLSSINPENIELIGIPKLDRAIKLSRDRDKIKIVGVAVNQNDDFDLVSNLIANLQLRFSVIIRKHPLDKREFPSNPIGIDGNKMSVTEFINLSDFLIASDSSIHVEANSLKCRSVYFPLHSNKNKYDYYSFIKNNFIEEVSTIEGLLVYLEKFDYSNFNFNSPSCQYYNSVLGTKNYGSSTALMLRSI